MKKRTDGISIAFALQLFTVFFQYGLSFLVTPIFTRVLSTSEYGILSTFLTYETFVTVLIGLQTKNSLGNAKVKYDNAVYKKYVSNIITIPLLSFLLLVIFAFIFKEQIGGLLGFQPALIPMIVLQAIVVYIVDYYTVYLRFDFRIRQSSIILICKGILVSGVSVLLLFLLSSDKYLSKIYGTIIPCALFSIFFIVILYREGKSFYNFEHWRYCLGITLPLVGYNISYLVMSQSDRVMLRHMTTDSEVGIYSVVYTLAVILRMVMESFDQAWRPYYFKLKSNNEIKELNHYIKTYIKTFTSITISFLLCAPEIFKIIAPDAYWDGLNLIPLVITSVFFDFLQTFSTNYELYRERTNISMGVTVICACVNVGLNYFLIPSLRGIGAMIATVISSLLMLCIHDLFCRFRIKGYEISIRQCLLSGLIVVFFDFAYYAMADLWLVRWGMALIIIIIIGCIILKTTSVMTIIRNSFFKRRKDQ